MFSKKSIFTFLQAQVAAFLGGITDYGLMILLTEVFQLHFAFSILISGTVGAVINFSINRFWVFKNQSGYSSRINGQLFKFALVVLGSISLKSFGTLIFQKVFQIDYRIGRLITDSFVSYGFNYPLIKYWVFRANKKQNIAESN
ncbi:GtrA family protein [Flavobacterium tructae]|uniref:Polysaccharide biosynthesis protein GtrA n=1 Tax=Flavobacterium tructae TaxID=1114873 RepID=A0A1S1J5T4_9FLAO|nr:GtrA family protein [Flavobacterium tructae]OHT44961.1 polysaccharide biosynthesis protein GtrA [Flavobacterium tructae]OXB18995.1 polysaccharide biosynthesis protein GtrA [Flavobacterium tructae]